MAGESPLTQLHVILDIDETLLYYITEKDRKHDPPRQWDNFPFRDHYQAEHDAAKAAKVAAGKPFNGHFVLRPNVKQFIQALFDAGYNVSLWTWSDADYAQDVANMIRGGNEFDNIWSEEDSDAAADYGPTQGHKRSNKDLNWLWYKKEAPGFYPCNTVLVDELKANTKNLSNFRNAIQLAEFLGDPDDNELMGVVLPQLMALADKLGSVCEDDSSNSLIHDNSVKFTDLYGGRRSTRRRRRRGTRRRTRRGRK
jgi:hypothetical protein